jgi:hypothetical protein
MNRTFSSLDLDLDQEALVTSFVFVRCCFCSSGSATFGSTPDIGRWLVECGRHRTIPGTVVRCSGAVPEPVVVARGCGG